MCIYMLGGRMRSWTNCFFSFNIFFLPKKKCKKCERNTENSNAYGFELHTPSIQGTRPCLTAIKEIIIIKYGFLK